MWTYKYTQERLKATCIARDIRWFEDPTNTKLVYHRNSVRKGLKELYTSSNSIVTRDRILSMVNFLAHTKTTLAHQGMTDHYCHYVLSSFYISI